MSKNLIKGSEHPPLPGARAIGKANPAERFEVTLTLRRRNQDKHAEHVKNQTVGDKSSGHIARENFAAQYGAEPADIALVKAFAVKQGLSVVQEHAGSGSVVLSGTVAQFNAAFGVDLQQYEHDGGTYRGHTGGKYVPDELHGVVQAVLGLDNRPIAKPHFRSRKPHGNINWRAAAGAATSYNPPAITQAYNFPTGNGAGQSIALIELGGGYRTDDLGAYFSNLGLNSQKVTAVSVDHGLNAPTGAGDGPDGEVMLDIEVCGAVAPNAHIVVYFAPNTSAGFLDAINAALHDADNKPSVISISWGGPESTWDQQSFTAFDSAFQDAATLGVTVFVASGDNGSGDGVSDGQNHVDFPASSPHVTACGGTNLQISGGAISSETVWNDGGQGGAGGGGVSVFFELPAWQNGLQITAANGGASPLLKRGVPDVAGDADPESGYNVRVDGQNTVIGGTSAVAPLWAGLIALINANNGKQAGFINMTLYKTPTALNDITQGNNGSFSASSGWDACTGLGSPNGGKLVTIL
ncbi:MAG: S53 family peptidase [Methylomonas sp.]|jgi:kumamolisin